MSILSKIARPLLAVPFIATGADAVVFPAPHRERIDNIMPVLRRFGVHQPSVETKDLATRGTGLVIILAGLALARSKAPRLAAATLATLQVPLAFANFPFWKHTGIERKEDIAGMITAAGLVGGALIASTDLGGKPSVAWRVNKQLESLAN